jgi:ornithine cyclodeaminase
MLDAAATALALPYPSLIKAVRELLLDPHVQVPPRQVLSLPNGGKLLVMPASDRTVAMTKLITYVGDNPARGLPTIQGNIVVFDALTGQHLSTLHGPTVTARRTAAVSVVAAQLLATRTDGPLLVVGAGVQGRSHLEAFHSGLGVQEVWVASRSAASANALVAHAQSMGMTARRVDDPNAALAHCPLVVSATSAQEVALHNNPRDDAFVAAVGAFTPLMVEWSARVCQHVAANGTLVVDTSDAVHEAGDLLQAHIDVAALATLADVVHREALRGAQSQASPGPVFFKSCGWGGWDLAAARCVVASLA